MQAFRMPSARLTGSSRFRMPSAPLPGAEEGSSGAACVVAILLPARSQDHQCTVDDLVDIGHAWGRTAECRVGPGHRSGGCHLDGAGVDREPFRQIRPGDVDIARQTRVDAGDRGLRHHWHRRAPGRRGCGRARGGGAQIGPQCRRVERVSGWGRSRAGRGATGQDDRPEAQPCLLYTSPSPRDRTRSRMPSSA